MLVRIATFLVDFVAGFFVVMLLVRFHMQWLRVGFRNQVGQFVLATTNWCVLPLRRVVPGLAGLDLSSLLAAWILQALGLWLIAAIVGASPAPVPLIAVSFVELLRYSVYILIFAVFMLAILSWINPYAPAMPVFDAITRPFLRPLRRFVGPIGGVDITPLILLALLWVLLFLVEGLSRAAAGL